jgi:hypothetical protein
VIYYSTHVALACAVEIRQSPFDAYISEFKALVHHAKIVLTSMGLLRPSSSRLSAVDKKSPRSVTATTISTSSPQTPVNKFTFEISLIPCLQVAATRCRCPVTRREAISLLALDLPREALWDAEMHLAIAKRVVEIEEQEVDSVTGWPTESRRLWCAVIDGTHVMDRNGRFRVRFAFAKSLQETSIEELRMRRMADAQWEEWITV